MDFPEIAIPILVAAAASAIATPLVARLARAVGAVDRPNARKVNRRQNIPLLGGLAVAVGFAAGLLAVTPLLDGAGEFWTHLGGFLVGGALILAVGVYDDRYGLGAVPKFSVQLLAALVAIHSGFIIPHLTEPLTWTTFLLPTWVRWLITIAWIVGVTNAINLIDGLDGLAAGLGAMIAATLALISWQADHMTGVLLGLILAGALMGFLPFNFQPAKIFLGDTGSLFIGYSLSIFALEGYRTTSFLPFVVPLLALAVPLLDTLLSILRRLRTGKPVFNADRLHMHHQLVETEGSDRRAVLALYFLTGCFCIIAISFTRLQGYAAILCFVAVVALTIRLLRNLGLFSIGKEMLEPAETQTGRVKGEQI